jgi:hypothetical protein
LDGDAERRVVSDVLQQRRQVLLGCPQARARAAQAAIAPFKQAPLILNLPGCRRRTSQKGLWPLGSLSQAWEVRTSMGDALEAFYQGAMVSPIRAGEFRETRRPGSGNFFCDSG